MRKKILFKQSNGLIKCYLDSALLETMIKRWYADLKRSRTNTNDAECSGCPNSRVVLESTKKKKNTTNSFWLIVN